MSSCCPSKNNSNEHGHSHKKKFDFILWGSLAVIVICYALAEANAYNLFVTPIPYFGEIYATSYEFLRKMWWGVALGIFFVGIMHKIPKEYFNAVLGKGDSFSGLLRATIAGLLLDLCNHGIIMVGAKLYERGASLAQVMAFLIASPWNSISLTIILISLIGLKWTLAFIIGSALIALFTGLIYQKLIRAGILPDNPNTIDLPKDFDLKQDTKQRLKTFKPSMSFFVSIAKAGIKESGMLIRWLLFGVVIAACLRTFIPAEMFTQWFGPTAFGLLITLIIATILEVCSEGSAPIASEIMHGANAPGNAFTFLMAGVATDYTEIIIIRETTKSWLIALSLPLITVPQIILLSIIINMAASAH